MQEKFMRESPIFFNGPMVRAILDGTKTQTRRVVKWRHPEPGLNHSCSGLIVYSYTPNTFTLESQGNAGCECRSGPTRCPYGQVGDRLWVRETFVQGYDIDPVSDLPKVVDENGNDLPMKTWYRASDDIGWSDDNGYMANTPWKPSIHMPKSAARIWLEVTNVRVERLHAISKQDAKHEGISTVHFRPCDGWPRCDGYMAGPDDGQTSLHTTAVKAFSELWETINGTGSWDTNPFVWVVEFKQIPAPTTDATTHPA